jgi:hypothetical protein
MVSLLFFYDYGHGACYISLSMLTRRWMECMIP